MKITREEYTRFSLPGRIRLLNLYGHRVAGTSAVAGDIIIVWMGDFFVALVTDRSRCNAPVAADPVPFSVARFLIRPGFYT